MILCVQHCSLSYPVSDNTFAGYWDTVVDCMENIEKMLAMINFNKRLPQNCVASSAKGLIVKTMSWLLKSLILFVQHCDVFVCSANQVPQQS